ncbi:hypothetical protein IPL68_07475 [Candidatus Saccharibacteria bacterium]|nr:MAG: hypothetical protein IPL68_07475 [Candidatus Saccharibacteria bacterium]
MRRPLDRTLAEYASTDTAYYDLRISWQPAETGLEALGQLGAADIAQRTKLFPTSRAIVASLERTVNAQISPKDSDVVGCMLISERNIGSRALFTQRARRPVIATMVVGGSDIFNRFSRVNRATEPPCTCTIEQEVGLNLVGGLLHARSRGIIGRQTESERYSPDTRVDVRSLREADDAKLLSSAAIWKMVGLEDTLVDAAGAKHHPNGFIRMWYAQKRLNDLTEAEKSVWQHRFVFKLLISNMQIGTEKISDY